MAKYQIWMEGYADSNVSGTASYEGEYEANSFEEACDKWANEKPSRSLYYIPAGRGGNIVPTYWGCKLFDNEADARKSFG